MSGLMLNRTAPVQKHQLIEKHQKNYFNTLPNSRINPYAINFLPHLGGPAMHIDLTLSTSMSPSPNVHCRKRYFTSPRLCGGEL